jgi:hypothetical protein
MLRLPTDTDQTFQIKVSLKKFQDASDITSQLMLFRAAMAEPHFSFPENLGMFLIAHQKWR